MHPQPAPAVPGPALGKLVPSVISRTESRCESDAAFIVLPGHERRDLEEVVAREENYVVVRKDPEVVADVASP